MTTQDRLQEAIKTGEQAKRALRKLEAFEEIEPNRTYHVGRP